MTDTTYVQQLRRTISAEFYFGAMCRETKRRIAISTDTSRGKQRYSQSGETIVSCNHCHKTHRFDNPRHILFSASRMGMIISIVLVGRVVRSGLILLKKDFEGVSEQH
jgi:hypothetical protein